MASAAIQGKERTPSNESIICYQVKNLIIQPLGGIPRPDPETRSKGVKAVMPLPVRALGSVAALLFAATALQIFAGRSLTPLSEPLPFFAYPVFVLTLFGWAWWCWRPAPQR
jgi:hypothetical protein